MTDTNNQSSTQADTNNQSSTQAGASETVTTPPQDAVIQTGPSGAPAPDSAPAADAPPPGAYEVGMEFNGQTVTGVKRVRGLGEFVQLAGGDAWVAV